jgi:hypothetical protein
MPPRIAVRIWLSAPTAPKLLQLVQRKITTSNHTPMSVAIGRRPEAIMMYRMKFLRSLALSVLITLPTLSGAAKSGSPAFSKANVDTSIFEDKRNSFVLVTPPNGGSFQFTVSAQDFKRLLPEQLWGSMYFQPFFAPNFHVGPELRNSEEAKRPDDCQHRFPMNYTEGMACIRSLPASATVDGHKIMRTKAGANDVYAIAPKHGQVVAHCTKYDERTHRASSCFVYLLQGEWLNRLYATDIRIDDMERTMCGFLSIRNRIWSGAPSFQCKF